MLLRTGGLVFCVAALAIAAACIPIADTTTPTPASNRAPVADAGDHQVVSEGNAVELNGAGSSDPDGDVLAYQWRQIAGPNVSLVNAGTSLAWFDAPAVDAKAFLSFQLTVDDGLGGRSAAVATVQVLSTTSKMALDAMASGPEIVPSGSLVTLQGEARGGEGRFSYNWLQNPVSGGPTVVLSSTDVASPTFTAPEVLTETVVSFILIVADEAGNTDTDEVSVTVGGILVANAGEDQSVAKNDTVTLAGSGQGGIGTLTYRWQQTGGTTVTLDDPNAASTTFTAPDPGANETLTFELVVSDGEGQSSKDTIDVELIAVLTAQAGGDETGTPGLTVSLEGLALAATGEVTYEWVQTAGTTVTLDDANSASPTFVAPLMDDDETLSFTLTVTDEASDSDTATVDVLIDVPRVRFSTSMGEFTILLRPDVAPIGVENFLRYVDEDFYPGLLMHRIIPDFVVQGGGWHPDLSATSRYSGIQIESDNGLDNVRGSVAYARTSEPDSATSEFFVNLIDNVDLDYVSDQSPGYAVFGRIVEGMDVIDDMAAVETHSEQVPWDPNVVFDDVPVEDILINEVALE